MDLLRELEEELERHGGAILKPVPEGSNRGAVG